MLYSNLMLAIVLLWALSLETQADEQCPNVALFLVDDFGWQDLGCLLPQLREKKNHIPTMLNAWRNDVSALMI
jgi:hypothetical protein